MTRLVVVFTAFLSLVVLGAPALAAASEPQLLTLEEARERAREENSRVRQSGLEILRLEMASREARMSRLPTVAAEGRYTNNLALPAIVFPPDSPFGEVVLRTGSRHNLAAGLQVSVPVFNAQLNRSIELSVAMVELERSLQGATVREVEIEVERAFLNGLLTREALTVLEESYEALQSNRRMVEALYAEGMVPEYDLIRTEVQVRNLEPEIARARNGHQGAVNYVKLLSGIAVETPLVLEGDLEALYQERAGRGARGDVGGNRDLRQLRGQRALMDRRVALERASRWPSLAAFGNINYSGQGDGLAFWDYQWTDTVAAGLLLSIPLFTPGHRQRLDQIQVEALQLEEQLAFVEESLRSQVITTENRLQELQEVIGAQERNIAQAERGFAIARQSYEEGVYSLMDVTDAESALRDARLNYSSALAEYVQALLDLEDLLGEVEP